MSIAEKIVGVNREKMKKELGEEIRKRLNDIEQQFKDLNLRIAEQWYEIHQKDFYDIFGNFELEKSRVHKKEKPWLGWQESENYKTVISDVSKIEVLSNIPFEGQLKDDKGQHVKFFFEALGFEIGEDVSGDKIVISLPESAKTM